MHPKFISEGSKPVLSHTENICILSIIRESFTDNEFYYREKLSIIR